MARGQCLCGTLVYELDGPFSGMFHCHCSICRKSHGTGFATFVAAPLSGFRWIAGADRCNHFQSSADGKRSFCAVCGSAGPLLLEERGIAAVPAGAFDEDPGSRPQGHLFVASKAAWDAITDDLKQFDAYPPNFDAEGVERAPAHTTAGVTSGSCRCGAVAYETTDAPLRMMNCHCSRCRHGRAAAHATNVFYGLDRFRWIRGESEITEFKVAGARFHTVAFCKHCGGKLPRPSVERGVVVVPAGSLDTDPGIRPQAHIFTADKAPWFDISGPLPQFPGMPPA